MFKPPNITQLFKASISGDGGGVATIAWFASFG